MNVWMNKQTGKIMLAHPHWEPLHLQFDEKFYDELDIGFKEMAGDRKIAHGTLLQVGWLLQNEHEVWLGMPLSITDQFEDLGEI